MFVFIYIDVTVKHFLIFLCSCFSPRFYAYVSRNIYVYTQNITRRIHKNCTKSVFSFLFLSLSFVVCIFMLFYVIYILVMEFNVWWNRFLFYDVLSDIVWKWYNIYLYSWPYDLSFDQVILNNCLLSYSDFRKP